MKKGEFVGQVLREARENIGASQESLSFHIGTSIKFVSMVETGERKLPLAYFPAVSEFLNLDLKKLFKAKLKEEMRDKKIKQMKRDLENSDEVTSKIELSCLKKMRSDEIDELIRFYNLKLQDHLAELKSHTAHRDRIRKQIEILTEEKELLGFGQMRLKL